MTAPGVPGGSSWRAAEADRLLAFARGSALPAGGFGWLDADGHVDPAAGRPLWITARMTHVFALAALQAVPGAAELATAGITSIVAEYADPDAGGWFASLDGQGRPSDTTKANYEHAFVLLAASSAVAADIASAQPLLADAAEIIERRFFQEADGRSVDTYDRTFTEPEPYRGANSNMHSVEAFLAAADVLADPAWRERALAIATGLIDGSAREHAWRLPEHYDTGWHPLLNYNHDHPDDPFRPFGATPGHSLEWARLLIDLDAALADPPAWLVEAAVALFDVAAGDGWRPDGHPGFVYTVDWQGRPVTSTRMHWVMAEAVSAADAIHRRTGDDRPAEIATSWWREIEDYFIDRRAGSWRHELDQEMRPANGTWSGKPDVYHAYQAVLLPSLPLAPVATVSLRQNKNALTD